MALKIVLLNLGNITIDSAFLVRGRMPGTIVTAPDFCYLILGGEQPILIDTGFRNLDVMAQLGMPTTVPEGYALEQQLASQGLEVSDIGCVIMTHLHADHAGKIDLFPMSTPVVINRSELAFAASGIQGPLYVREDLKHVIDRTYTPGAIRYLDLELTGQVEILPGVSATTSGGHTGGSMNVLVETSEGVACICGDIIYDIQAQVVAPTRQFAAMEPELSNNFSPSTLEEKASIKKALNAGRFLLPSHDLPAKVVAGKVVGRLESGEVPGPVIPLATPEPALPS